MFSPHGSEFFSEVSQFFRVVCPLRRFPHRPPLMRGDSLPPQGTHSLRQPRPLSEDSHRDGRCRGYSRLALRSGHRSRQAGGADGWGVERTIRAMAVVGVLTRQAVGHRALGFRGWETALTCRVPLAGDPRAGTRRIIGQSGAARAVPGYSGISMSQPQITAGGSIAHHMPPRARPNAPW
jgi:hypothetical protein